MRGLWVLRKGLLDTYEHLLGFSLASLGWVVVVVLPLAAVGQGFLPAVLLLFLAPGATFALFAVTDPRRAIDRPAWREVVALGWGSWRRAWLLALIFVPIGGILVWNIGFYAGGPSGALAVLIPLWLVLLVITVLVGFAAFACGALFPAPPRATLRRAVYVVVTAPFRAVAVLLALLLVAAICSALVVPAILFLPAIVAATIDRLALQVLDVPVIDPNTPTDEAVHEVHQPGARRPGKGRWWARG